MGCDIHTLIQVRTEKGWEVFNEKIFLTELDIPTNQPFMQRSYRLFGVLAGVRNYSEIPPIKLPIGWPADLATDDGWVSIDANPHNDIYLGDHSKTWYSLKELLEFDWLKTCEDRRAGVQIAEGLYSGAGTCEPGKGAKMTYAEAVGWYFMCDLEILRERFDSLEDVRILIGFDS